jgi:hypothetical protein
MIIPSHVDEPREAREYAEVFSQVATSHKPIIVRRAGVDLAAVGPLEHLELLRELAARREAESLAARIDWNRSARSSAPPQEWSDGDEPKPF